MRPEAEGNIEASSLRVSWRKRGIAIELLKLDIGDLARMFLWISKGSCCASDRSASGELKLKTSGLSLAHGVNSIKALGEFDKAMGQQVPDLFPEIAKKYSRVERQMIGSIQLKVAQRKNLRSILFLL